MTQPLSIAVVDDEPQIRRALGRLLGSHGHEVELFEDGRTFLASHVAHHFDCILLDLNMPGMSGFEVLGSLASDEHYAPVIVLTAQDQPGTTQHTAELGALAHLTKPVEETRLLEALDRCTGALNQGSISFHAPASQA